MDTALTVTGLNEAQRMILEQRTPTEAIRYRQGRGNARLAYVSHAWVTRVLNEAFGFRWSWDVTDTVIIPDLMNPAEVIVRGRLTVTTPDGGTVVKEQFGSTDVKRFKDGGVISLGDDLKAASSDALKKAASLLGVALDLYGASDDPLPGEEPPPKATTGATKPAAQRNASPAPTQTHKAPTAPTTSTDAEFERLPSASTAPAQAAALAKAGEKRAPNGANGNGHKQAEATRPTWRTPAEAIGWAEAMGCFSHPKHAANAFDKARREYAASTETPSTSEFYDLWHAHVLARCAELHAELDAQAAETPPF